jgi:hypothetical protein
MRRVAGFALGIALALCRLHFFQVNALGNACLAAGMALQFVGYQRILAQDQPKGLIQGLAWSQWGWFLFALALPGAGPAMGALGFLVLRLLVKEPLQGLVGREGFGSPWLVLVAFFALAGCLPFASFSAYFQTFIPLMSESAAVNSMSQKLFSGAGLWAAIVLLSVVYQSCALGYFYWSRILQAGPDLERRRWNLNSALLCLGLAGSAGLGIFRSGYGDALRACLVWMGVDLK